MSQVTLTNHPRFSLLRPQPTPARTGDSYQVVAPDNNTLEGLLESATYSELVALDFETKGTDYSLDNTETFVVGIGLAWDTGSCYIPLGGIEYSSKVWKHLDFIIQQHPGLLAHNVYFDGGWVRRDYGAHAQWHACTFGLYMQLAGEGWVGQRWGLKDAMVDVLMWADTNETELDEWLMANGHVKGHNKPKKELMYLAPADILGKYCVLDAEATYLLYTEHLAPLLEKFPQVLTYHQEDFLPHVLIHIDQKMHGILTDTPHWSNYTVELQASINIYTRDFLAHPLVAPHVKAYQDGKLQTHLDKEPQRYLKVKERKEPARLTKSGEVSKNWMNWDFLRSMPPKQSKNWEKWDLKREAIEAGQDSDYLFNIQSGDQLRWLLYERLGFTPVDFTDSGEPAVGEDSLKGMGELGQLLIKRIGAAKELSYLTDYLERTVRRPTLHPSFKMPGTVTGRLAGKEPNLQQCFASDTEALTPSGWKLIKDLQVGELVWTIQPDTLFGQWGLVQATTQRHYSGDMVAIGMANNTPLLVTPDHRLLLVGDLNHTTETERTRRVTAMAANIHKFRTKECMAHASLRPSTTTESFFSERDIWMAAATQADGSSARQKNPYVWRFGFKRDRKIQKFTELVGVPANHINAKGVHTWHKVEFEHPLLTADKKFDLSVLGDNQIETFVEAISFWDGHKRGTSKGAFEFTCVHEDVVDAVQALLVRHGYGVRKFKRPLAYSLYIRKGSHREYKKSHVTTQPYDGMVYCLSVETEHVLVRRGTSTYVTSQCPKTKGTLSGFIARSGHIFVDCDVNALEMVVTAELSQDKNLLSLYGPNAKKNDIYLFYSSMMPILGPAIRATGYDPYNPTPETMDAAKKQCKRERSIAKLLILSDNYGSGIGKKQKILSLNGVNMSRDEVTEMHEALLDAKSGVLDYVRYLEDQWEMNKGWVINGYGRPIAVHESKKKDLLNRVVQGSGHDILQLYCRIARDLLTKAGITWYPIVMDWHDEIIVEVPEHEADAAMKILEKDAFAVLNELLGGTCPLKGSAAKAKTLAGVKLEE